MSTRARRVVGVLVAVLAVNLVLVGIDRATRGPQGPASSSYATSPRGLAAYAELLARSGRPVRRLRERLTGDALAGAGTVVVLDPQALAPAEARALAAHMRRGGRVVAGASPPGPWLGELLGGSDREPEWEGGGRTRARVLAPSAETSGVRTVVTAGRGVWAEPRGALPLVGRDGDDAVIVAATVGRGRLVLLADASPLQNRLLGAGDNAALGLGLVPRGERATFAEAAHGYGARHGLAAIPDRWKLALAGLIAAALVLMLSRARRLGPAEQTARRLAPPRRDYVDAMAIALKRTRAPDEATRPVAAAARDRLGDRDGEDAGLTSDEVAALLGPASSEDAVLARGRALAKLSRGGT